MAFSIITKNSERTFADKEIVNICSKDGFDFKLNVGFDCMLSVQYDVKLNKCTILNQFNNPKFLDMFLNTNISDYYASLYGLKDETYERIIDRAIKLKMDDYSIAKLLSFFNSDYKLKDV